MPSKSADSDLEILRETWKILYTQTLPSLARAKDPSQSKWPVTLDHCFARIILDNTVGHGAGQDGEDVQWDMVLGKPAVKMMNDEQLHKVIELGQKIQQGKVDLVELDRKSLEARGKVDTKYRDQAGPQRGSKKEETTHATGSEINQKRRWPNVGNSESGGMQAKSPSKKRKQQDDGKRQSILSFAASSTIENDTQLPLSPISKGQGQPARSDLEKSLNTTSQLSHDQFLTTLQRIQSHPNLTPFRRRLYISLLSVPCGTYTTYAALATHLNSAARAVGSGMRHNPFAPEVPCHRVLASNGTIGGFYGEWGRDGKNTGMQNKKITLLKEEGVRFDSEGKVKGPIWKGFWDLEDFERELGQDET